MTIDNLKNTPHVFLWGFDSDGNLFIDARVTILKYDQSEIKSLKGVDLRHMFNSHLNSSMIWLPNDCSFNDIENLVKEYNKTKDEHTLNIFKKAKIKISNLFREKSHESNAIDFILNDD